jgi:hypothetical protein
MLYGPCIPSFFRAFIMKRYWILSKAFFCIYCDNHVIFVLVFIYVIKLHLLISVCWTILVSMEWN